LRKINVIIVDDQYMARQLFELYIKSSGRYQLAGTASSGQQALSLVQAVSADLILMDIRMPVMSGLEAARQIRAMSRTDAQTVPIIAMTANAYEEDVSQSLAAGMNAHLAKPIEPQVILDTLAGYIGSKN